METPENIGEVPGLEGIMLPENLQRHMGQGYASDLAARQSKIFNFCFHISTWNDLEELANMLQADATRLREKIQMWRDTYLPTKDEQHGV